MFKLLLVSKTRDALSDFCSGLRENDSNELLYSDSGEEAIKVLKQNSFDLVITDEDVGDMSGLELARKLITVSPLTNCVAVSSLSEEDFHEASEGLGLMTHLPLNPGTSEADNLLKNLRQIKGLESIGCGKRFS
ncbi:MAG: response regulator [Deltaproteobacteria bacterium]|nr:response regulator [Deltaproteobacteria bacterium]